MKIDCIPYGFKLGFIGQLSHLDVDLKSLFPAPLKVIPRDDHNTSDDKDKAELLKTFSYGEDEVRRLCKLLEVDYVCFNIPLPLVCQQ
jgi:hypothetical protein